MRIVCSLTNVIIEQLGVTFSQFYKDRDVKIFAYFEYPSRMTFEFYASFCANDGNHPKLDGSSYHSHQIKCRLCRNPVDLRTLHNCSSAQLNIVTGRV